VNKKWGVRAELDMSNDDKNPTDKAILVGWLNNIESIPELENILVMVINFTQAVYGSENNINKILELPPNKHIFTCYFPIFNPKATSEEIEKEVCKASGGLLHNFKLKSFNTKSDLIKWVLNIKQKTEPE